MNQYRILLCLFLFGFGYSAAAQTIKSYPAADCNTAAVMRVVKGDTILIDCDTIFVVNKKTFRVLQEANGKIRNGDFIPKELLTNSFETIEKLNETVERNQGDYTLLKLRFDSLAKNSVTVIDRTLQNVSDASASNQKAIAGMAELQKKLKDVQTLLEKERKIRRLEKLKWGIGGVGVGGLLATVVFLVMG